MNTLNALHQNTVAHNQNNFAPPAELFSSPTLPAEQNATMFIKFAFEFGSPEQILQSLTRRKSVSRATFVTGQPTSIEVSFNPRFTRGTQILRELQKSGYPRVCTALVYLRNNDSQMSPAPLSELARSTDGVIAFQRSEHKKHVYLIHFDPSRTQGSRIVAKLREMGHPALQVGC